jgi:hypothetical protein
MTMTDFGKSRRHVGRAGGDDEDNGQQYYSRQTREADAHAFFMKVRDVVHGVLLEDGFNRILNHIRKTAQIMPAAEFNPAEAVVEVTDRIGLTDSESGAMLKHLASGGDLSGWGIINAVTATAREHDNYDRGTELEAIAGNMTAWTPREWAGLKMLAQ